MILSRKEYFLLRLPVTFPHLVFVMNLNSMKLPE